MPRALLALACLLLLPVGAPAFQADPQTLREQLNSPDFAKILNQILATVKPGSIPQIDTRTGAHIFPDVPAVFVGISPAQKLVLPAGVCSVMELMYRCEWETKTNKYTVAVLEDDLSAAVAAALPNTWTRKRGEDYAKRFTDFTDPTGEIVISVSCPTSNGNFPLNAFTATLTIHRAAFPMR